MVDCLIEIGTEELPPKSLSKLSEALSTEFRLALATNQISFHKITDYSSPRRLALLVKEIGEKQEDVSEERRGPSVASAFDEQGEPTKAGLGFARSCQVSFEDLDRLENEKGSWLVYRHFKPGKPTKQLLIDMLQQAIDKLPIAKRMRWGSGDSEFVRPVHWVMLRLGDELVAGEILSQHTIPHSYGHRFHVPQPVSVEQCRDYATTLKEKGKVIAVTSERRRLIEEGAQRLAKEKNLIALIDEALLTEVCGLVEWPVPLMGEFDEKYLSIPKEVVITAMQTHQKYFSTINSKGELQPYFIFISNLESPAPEKIIEGNEKVLRARLADAQFFYETDKKQTLSSRQSALEQVIYQRGLGTLAQKVARLEKLISLLEKKMDLDLSAAKRGAGLCKNDLTTEMVAEFPELQGTMGRYYALHEGELREVADTIEQHYWPRFSGDQLPLSQDGCYLALVDKVDHLVGTVSAGHRPSGDKDPFALRRSCLGIIRLLTEGEIPVSIDWLFTRSYETYEDKNLQFDKEFLEQYFYERLKGYYLEQSVPLKHYSAVRALNIDDLVDFQQRLSALKSFTNTDAARSLSAANKRVLNILKKSGVGSKGSINQEQLQETAELELVKQMNAKAEKIESLMKQRAYEEVLVLLSELKTPVDQFFDQILVLHESQEIRENRLNILRQLRGQLMQVGDLSQLS